jgi:hypothetical protein
MIVGSPGRADILGIAGAIGNARVRAMALAFRKEDALSRTNELPCDLPPASLNPAPSPNVTY